MDDNEDYDADQARLREVVPAAINGVVTKWVLVVEFIDPVDGEKTLGKFTSEGCKTWESYGMLGIAQRDDEDQATEEHG